jgi:chromosome segregation ATPase
MLQARAAHNLDLEIPSRELRREVLEQKLSEGVVKCSLLYDAVPAWQQEQEPASEGQLVQQLREELKAA